MAPSPAPAPSTAALPAQRLHALDAIRALAMFLGVILHASLSFMREDHLFTPRMDRSRCFLFDLEVYAVHAFRMQLFFLIAGCFTGLLLARRSPTHFALGRLKRVVLPLLVGTLTVVPLTGWPFALAAGRTPDPADLIGLPAHLWFLVYLTIFSTAAWLTALFLQRFPSPALARAVGLLAHAAASRWAILLLALPTVLLNMLMPGWFIETPWQWVPQPSTLAYYAFFFLTGFAIQRRGVVLALGRAWKWQLPLALIVLFPLMVAVGSNVPATATLPPNPTLQLRLSIIAAAAAQALFTWGMILGLSGLFVSFCAHPRPWVRWLADSSYWVYLVHLPAVYWAQYAVADLAVPGMSPGPLEACVKFSLMLAAVLAFTLVTYALFVRTTILESIIGGGTKTNPTSPV